jgi:hypothetical protein
MTTTPIKSITDELLAEIDQCCQRFNGGFMIESSEAIGLVSEIRRLRAENEALRGDKALLDWLADPENEIGNVQLPTKCVMENMGSLRDAIRQAMQSNTEGN